VKSELLLVSIASLADLKLDRVLGGVVEGETLQVVGVRNVRQSSGDGPVPHHDDAVGDGEVLSAVVSKLSNGRDVFSLSLGRQGDELPVELGSLDVERELVVETSDDGVLISVARTAAPSVISTVTLIPAIVAAALIPVTTIRAGVAASPLRSCEGCGRYEQRKERKGMHDAGWSVGTV